jgi:hypothetical protein
LDLAHQPGLTQRTPDEIAGLAHGRGEYFVDRAAISGRTVFLAVAGTKETELTIRLVHAFAQVTGPCRSLTGLRLLRAIHARSTLIVGRTSVALGFQGSALPRARISKLAIRDAFTFGVVGA